MDKPEELNNELIEMLNLISLLCTEQEFIVMHKLISKFLHKYINEVIGKGFTDTEELFKKLINPLFPEPE